MKTEIRYNPNLNCWYEFNPIRAEIVMLTETMRALVETSDRELIHQDESVADYEDLYEHLVEKLCDALYY